MGSLAARLRSAGLSIAMRNCLVELHCGAVYAPSTKYGFCVYRPVHAPRVGPAAAPCCAQRSVYDYGRLLPDEFVSSARYSSEGIEFMIGSKNVDSLLGSYSLW